MEAVDWDGLYRSCAVILVSEIGDKTFLVAALLAMRYSRAAVFTGAILALAVMSMLSAALGHVVPTLLPKRYTTFAAALLFLFFGARMLKEGLEMEDSKERMQEEIEEVEREVEEIEHNTAVADASHTTNGSSSFIPLRDLEEGNAPTTAPTSSEHPDPDSSNNKTSSSPKDNHPPKGRRRRRSSLSAGVAKGSFVEGFRNLCVLIFSPIVVQTFILTFLAEWGDRSQISTIALAAAHSVYVVSVGTILGHCVCTFVAVMGGRWLATKISVKHVTLGGAVLFLLFGMVYTFEGVYWEESSLTAPS